MALTAITPSAISGILAFREKSGKFTSVDQFRRASGLSDEEFDTIGGLVIQAFGHMPGRNEVTRIDDYEFMVINADQRKIHSLRLRPPGNPEQ